MQRVMVAEREGGRERRQRGKEAEREGGREGRRQREKEASKRDNEEKDRNVIT